MDESFITLYDETGSEIVFEILDHFEFEGCNYVALIPSDDEKNEVMFFEFVESEDSDEDEYLFVDDEKLLDKVFNVFKERNKDEFNFD